MAVDKAMNSVKQGNAEAYTPVAVSVLWVMFS
jgi:hypothetical protein